MKVQEIITIVLLVIIALELAYIAVQLRPIEEIRPPWPAVTEQGLLGEIPDPFQAQTISERLNYLVCGQKVLIEATTKQSQEPIE